jgi:hypothetical protein
MPAGGRETTRPVEARVTRLQAIGPEDSLPDTRWLPHPQVTVQRDGDGAVLLHLRTNRYFELNATGLRVWELITAGSTTDEIAQALVREFAVEEPDAREAVDALIRDLADEDLVVSPDRPRGRVGRWLRRLAG